VNLLNQPAGIVIDPDVSVTGCYFVLLFEDCLPINLFRRMTIAIPEKKKSTGAYSDV
jgi:hypothetical protein